MDNLSVFGDIGQMIGYPAMLLIFWLYNKVKEMQKRLDKANKDSMRAIRSDVSFIRGFIEGKNSVNKEDE